MRKFLLFSLVLSSEQILAMGLPSNPPTQPSSGSWISVPITPATTATTSPASLSLVNPQTKQVVNTSAITTAAAESAVKPQVSSEIQIGSSFFESAGAPVVSIRQVGISFEERPNMVDAYIFFNQLLPNNIFYEVRGYTGYNYQTNNPFLPSLPISNQTLPMGYGFVGILGYVIPLNENLTLMPFMRLSYYNNFSVVYASTNGDSINSDTYMAQAGARLSMKVNKVFAMYVNYWAGYHDTYMNGTGQYASSDNPQMAGFLSTFELGFPYRMTKSTSIIPYMQYNTTAENPNSGAMAEPYNARVFTNVNNLVGLRFSYDF